MGSLKRTRSKSAAPVGMTDPTNAEGNYTQHIRELQQSIELLQGQLNNPMGLLQTALNKDRAMRGDDNLLSGMFGDYFSAIQNNNQSEETTNTTINENSDIDIEQLRQDIGWIKVATSDDLPNLPPSVPCICYVENEEVVYLWQDESEAWTLLVPAASSSGIIEVANEAALPNPPDSGVYMAYVQSVQDMYYWRHTAEAWVSFTSLRT